jgi:hypothetical protein
MDQCCRTIVVVSRKPKNISTAHAVILYPVCNVNPAFNKRCTCLSTDVPNFDTAG